MKRRFITKADIILAIVLLVLGLGSPFLMQKKSSDASMVTITIDGKEAGCFELSGNRSFGVFKDGDGSYGLIDLHFISAVWPEDHWDNLIIIEDGSVYVKSASCRGNDCVDTGPISREGQVIACLPHKLLITISGKEDGPDVIL